MDLHDHFVNSGNWLFRWRSYLPLVVLALVLAGVPGLVAPGFEVSHTARIILALLSGFLGLGIRAFTIGHTPRGTSGRNTRVGQVAETLNTTGSYSVVRHPLYVGNYFMWLGPSLVPGTWWTPVMVTLAFWVYYERIMAAEESFLRARFGEAFDDWARRTPAFVPRLGLWTAPALPFSLRTVLKREYSGLLGLVATIFVVDLVTNWAAPGPLVFPGFWVVLGPATLTVYLVLSVLKKRTRLLHVDGR